MSTKNSLPNITFIIPTYTNYDGLSQVLLDIAKHYPDMSCVIVNNGKSVPKIPTDLKKYFVLQEPHNVGFAKGCNDGVKMAIKKYRPDYFIFLNDDVRMPTEWISHCISYIKKYGWIATTPLLKRPDGILENIGYRILKKGRAQLMNTQDPNIDGLTAASLLFEKHAFEKLHGFDERFFAYLEDVDLFLRAKKEGLKFGVTTSTYVLHEGQATSSKMSIKKAWLDLRNWIYLIAKNWTKEDLVKYAPSIFLERLRNLIGFVKAIMASFS